MTVGHFRPEDRDYWQVSALQTYRQIGWGIMKSVKSSLTTEFAIRLEL